ncbi:MAG: glycosyl transferase, partial [Rhizomicrobium sp.]
NWAEWFESVSLVDATLRAASDFTAMDFPTRDIYRRAIERLARNCDLSEIEVARAATNAANQARAATHANTRSGHESDPGYYLIARGRRGFERQLGCRESAASRLLRLNAESGIGDYVGMIVLAAATVLAGALFGVVRTASGSWALAALAVLGAIPASDVAVSLVNRIVNHGVGAALLPGLELRNGVPADLRTIVVVPCLLTSRELIDGLIERLEVHYLSNSDDNLHFALLSDWTDSTSEISAGDEDLASYAAEGIARLNDLHGPAKAGVRFFLLHRRRVWNEGEKRWIGWERKRGKLHELNRLLRGATDTTFRRTADGQSASPPDIRYVITLDADTRIPIGAARRMIGKMAHPLTRPRFDPAVGRVVEGHGILQPRVTPSLPMAREGSLFQRAFSGPNGLDPYAFAVSDVYQDMFEEGSYVGKGIYDIDVVERAMVGRIPENMVLSHDLLEGIFARAGLVSDIEVVEEFPSRYEVAAARQHRWARGDWQLLPWIFGRGPGSRDADGQGAVSAVGRWKLLDNLRRSLSAPATLAAFIAGWLLPLHAAVLWTVFLLFTIAFPALLPAVAGLVPRSAEVSMRSHLKGLGKDLTLGLLQSTFLLTFLAHQAWLMVDAVIRTLYRQFVTGKRLLEWTTADQSAANAQLDRRSLWVQIAASAAFATAVGAVIVLAGHHTWPIAAPFAALWVLSPVVARMASWPPPADEQLRLTEADSRALRLIARRTWRFFETFVTAEDNMLPPDNFQEDPHPVVAHRTSPTNIGLYLLSVVAARDFGWHGTLDAVDRLETTFAAMGRLDRFRGHFYNWYDTKDLRALDPRYISSVDSGNLAGHLITLGSACREMIAGPTIDPNWRTGLQDGVELVAESLRDNPHVTPPPGPTAAIEQFARLLERSADDAFLVAQLLEDLLPAADAIGKSLTDGSNGTTAEMAAWSAA